MKNMKKQIFTTIAVFVTFAISLQLSTAAVGSLTSKANVAHRLAQVFEAKTNAVSNNQRDVLTEKELQDFSGNKYTLIEMSPTGYMIYHTDSGQFVEYSIDAPSPYLEFYDNLYYGGATQYYVYNGDTFIHTVLDETASLEY